MPSSLQFPSLGYIAKPETNARSLLCNNIPYLGHVGDPYVMVFPAALLMASNGDVGCGAAHSVSAPRALPLAAMLSSPPPRSKTLEPTQKAFIWRLQLSPPTPPIRQPNALQHARAMQAVRRCRRRPCGGQRAWVSLSPVVSSRHTPCLSASASKTRCSLLGVRARAGGGAACAGVMCRLDPKATMPRTWFYIP